MFHSALTALLSRQEDRRLHQPSTIVFIQQHRIALYFFLNENHCDNLFTQPFHSSFKYFLLHFSQLFRPFSRPFLIFFAAPLSLKGQLHLQMLLVIQFRGVSKSLCNFQLSTKISNINSRDQFRCLLPYCSFIQKVTLSISSQ